MAKGKKKVHVVDVDDDDDDERVRWRHNITYVWFITVRRRTTRDGRRTHEKIKKRKKKQARERKTGNREPSEGTNKTDRY